MKDCFRQTFLKNTQLYSAGKLLSSMNEEFSETLGSCSHRVHTTNEYPINPDGNFVLYWMTASRRYHYNSALEHSISLSIKLNKPLLIVEAVSIRHIWSSDRILTFFAQGIIDNSRIFQSHNLTYVPWVETHKQTGNGLLRKLSRNSCAVVIDDFPTYLPRDVMRQASKFCKVRLDAVDSNGILPISWADRAFPSAYSFRKYMQKNLLSALAAIPEFDPMENVSKDLLLPNTYVENLFLNAGSPITPYEWLWRVAQGGEIGIEACAPLDIDHAVPPVNSKRGGRFEAVARLDRFLKKGLDRYDSGRNNPDDSASSGLSPWLHFGHISSVEVVKAVWGRSDWDPSKISIEDTGRGTRSGWWGVPEAHEAFLDQIITWRELGFNFAHMREDHNSIESIPDWAKTSLDLHSSDPREEYTFEQIENAETGDEIWNAAQRQLVRSGHIDNYLRMLWGKRILEWAPNPETAAEWMININDRWALDGRDPNSYTGIFWVLGRHDRAWGPERPIFGKVRYMSSQNTRKKLHLERYLARWAEDAPIPK